MVFGFRIDRELPSPDDEEQYRNRIRAIAGRVVEASHAEAEAERHLAELADEIQQHRALWSPDNPMPRDRAINLARKIVNHLASDL